MLTFDERFFGRCKRMGYKSSGMKALWLTVCLSTVYKFRRNHSLYNWHYEVEMPGYGVPANKEKWVDVTVIGKVI